LNCGRRVSARTKQRTLSALLNISRHKAPFGRLDLGRASGETAISICCFLVFLGAA
jgi:hypothetical protein